MQRSLSKLPTNTLALLSNMIDQANDGCRKELLGCKHNAIKAISLTCSKPEKQTVQLTEILELIYYIISTQPLGLIFILKIKKVMCMFMLYTCFDLTSFFSFLLFKVLKYTCKETLVGCIVCVVYMCYI